MVTSSVNMECKKSSSGSELRWDPMWFIAFKKKMVFACVVTYCFLAVFGILSRRIFHCLLGDLKQVTPYQKFVCQYHMIAGKQRS